MMADPHSLIEGIVIASYAVRCNVRVHLPARRAGARRPPRCSTRSTRRTRPGYLGKNILGTGFDLELIVHSGAGAYICGEETALLDSLEGYRGQPRLQAAVPGRPHGLYAVADRGQQRRDARQRPVRSSCGGADWFEDDGRRSSRPARRSSRCPAASTSPGQYEAPMGTTLRELLEMAGGVRAGHELKFWTPGGSSHPAAHRRAPRRAAGLRGHGQAPARCSAPPR